MKAATNSPSIKTASVNNQLFSHHLHLYARLERLVFCLIQCDSPLTLGVNQDLNLAITNKRLHRFCDAENVTAKPQNIISGHVGLVFKH
jgi:hypothetical protein